jgi:hypothetical protein
MCFGPTNTIEIWETYEKNTQKHFLTKGASQKSNQAKSLIVLALLEGLLASAGAMSDRCAG